VSSFVPIRPARERVTVVVTAVGGGGLGEQLIKALRLADIDYRIVGTDVDAASKGLMEVDVAELVPSAREPGFTAALLELCERHTARALLCGSESELKVLDRDREEFSKRQIFLPINSPTVLRTCLDKVETAAFLAAHGFGAPRWKAIASLAELSDFPYLPAVLKPSVGGGGSANLYLAQTARELAFFAEHLLGIYPQFIAQEYVGRPDAEFTVGVLSDMDGEVLNSIAIRRHILPALSNRLKVPNRTGRSDLGPMLAISNGVSQGEVGAFPDVTGPCEAIARALGSRGALNIQCRLVAGEVVVFEINPRFSGTTSLRAMMGYNEPDVLIRRHVLKETIEPRFPYSSGLVLRGLAEVLVDPTRARHIGRAQRDRA
jgi:carbamoyl-phosphate synthase large subunit